MPGARTAAACCALVLLIGHLDAQAADLQGFQSPLGWDGRVIQPDGLYALTLPDSWTLTPLDENSVLGSAPGEDSLFIYVTVAEKQSDSLDSLLDTLMELPKREMKAFREISRKPITQDGHEGKTLQAEENDGAWNKVFYIVIFTDTHQYLLRTGCRLDRFPALQPVVKKIVDSFYVGAHRMWMRETTYPIVDLQGRYTVHVPPGWRVERRKGTVDADDANGTTTIKVTVRDRSHRSLEEFGAALDRTLRDQYPGYRVGAPMNLPEYTASNQAARRVVMVTEGPEGNKVARVYAIALTDRSEFLVEGLIRGAQGGPLRNEGVAIGRLLGLWRVHLRPGGSP